MEQRNKQSKNVVTGSHTHLLSKKNKIPFCLGAEDECVYKFLPNSWEFPWLEIQSAQSPIMLVSGL